MTSQYNTHGEALDSAESGKTLQKNFNRGEFSMLESSRLIFLAKQKLEALSPEERLGFGDVVRAQSKCLERLKSDSLVERTIAIECLLGGAFAAAHNEEGSGEKIPTWKIAVKGAHKGAVNEVEAFIYGLPEQQDEREHQDVIFSTDRILSTDTKERVALRVDKLKEKYLILERERKQITKDLDLLFSSQPTESESENFDRNKLKNELGHKLKVIDRKIEWISDRLQF